MTLSVLSVASLRVHCTQPDAESCTLHLPWHRVPDHIVQLVSDSNKQLFVPALIGSAS